MRFHSESFVPETSPHMGHESNPVELLARLKTSLCPFSLHQSDLDIASAAIAPSVVHLVTSSMKYRIFTTFIPINCPVSSRAESFLSNGILMIPQQHQTRLQLPKLGLFSMVWLVLGPMLQVTIEGMLIVKLT